jgi:hypothetical protein
MPDESPLADLPFDGKSGKWSMEYSNRIHPIKALIAFEKSDSSKIPAKRRGIRSSASNQYSTSLCASRWSSGSASAANFFFTFRE